MEEEKGPRLAAADEAAVAQLLNLVARAGFSMSEQKQLREAISVWLPRFLRRSDAPNFEPAAVEIALLKLVADYARRVRQGLTPG